MPSDPPPRSEPVPSCVANHTIELPHSPKTSFGDAKFHGMLSGKGCLTAVQRTNRPMRLIRTLSNYLEAAFSLDHSILAPEISTAGSAIPLTLLKRNEESLIPGTYLENNIRPSRRRSKRQGKRPVRDAWVCHRRLVRIPTRQRQCRCTLQCSMGRWERFPTRSEVVVPPIN